MEIHREAAATSSDGTDSSKAAYLTSLMGKTVKVEYPMKKGTQSVTAWSSAFQCRMGTIRYALATMVRARPVVEVNEPRRGKFEPKEERHLDHMLIRGRLNMPVVTGTPVIERPQATAGDRSAQDVSPSSRYWRNSDRMIGLSSMRRCGLKSGALPIRKNALNA
jgi:hypothetical protein